MSVLSGYDDAHEVNLGGYGASLASYAALVTAALVLVRREGRPLPDQGRSATS